MPCSCFGKKDKKAGGAAEEKYSRPHEQEPLSPSSQAPAQTQAPAPAQVEPTTTTPPAPHTPPAGGDARLRPEDDPDKASRRRDVVASFYSDQCELIGFKATGSRPPSAVVGGAGEGPAATSSPLSSPPSSSRSCATSRADLAMKRREFFKDLAVNDISSARYGTSQPTWKLVDSGSLTTPRRSHQQDSPQHHTLPFQARAGGLVLRPTSTPPAATLDHEPRITNGDSEHSHDQRTDDSKEPEGEPLLGSDLKQEPSPHHPQADAVQQVPPPHHSEPEVMEPLLSGRQSAQDQSTPSTPATPPATPATPPGTPAEAAPFVAEVSTPSQPLGTEVHTDPVATQLGGGPGECGHLSVQQQYVQQVSVASDDERLAEGSCILIKEAFPDEPHEPRPDPDTPPLEAPHTTSASGSPPAPPATHEAARDVSQHSSEQPAAPPPTEGPGQRRASLPGAEEAAGERSPRHIGEAALDNDQHSRPTSSSGDSSAPGSPQQHRQLLENEDRAPAAAPLQQQQDPPSPQQEAPDSPGETRPDVTIVGCIPKAAPSEEADPHLPSPPTTPPASSPPSTPTTPAGEESRPPAPPTPPTVDDRAPPSPPTPPSLSEPGMTCGVDASSSPLEDDGLGSDIDDALSSLECLTEEGNTEKRAAAST